LIDLLSEQVDSREDSGTFGNDCCMKLRDVSDMFFSMKKSVFRGKLLALRKNDKRFEIIKCVLDSMNE